MFVWRPTCLPLVEAAEVSRIVETERLRDLGDLQTGIVEQRVGFRDEALVDDR